MAFERPLTIMEALRKVDRNEYALPALQREFVWKPAQICRLFDSIMKGYPIGSFLFWKLEPETAKSFQFFQFMRDYHQLTNPYCEEYPHQTAGPETAVLDGQQRLTAFNIALYGSYANKKKYVRRDNPRAYPKKKLYLNLLDDGYTSEGGDYAFKFLTEKEAARRDESTYWFEVGMMKDFDTVSQCFKYLTRQDLGESMTTVTDMAMDLHEVLHTSRIVSYYLEEDQDLDKVLNIFIRVNSGGTQLGYADLLLSIATTQWKEVDARREINDLVTALNSYGHEQHFNFNKDFVLKAGLSLTRRPSVKFAAANFTAENMQAMERAWPGIADALRLSAKLLHDYGMGRRHIRAPSAVIVIAYYLYFKGYDDAFRMRAVHDHERAEIRRWYVLTSLSGTWGAGFADKLLARIPEFFDEHDVFDCDALLDLTRRAGRDPYLDSDGIDELLELPYNHRGVYLALSLVFDSVQARSVRAEVDHIYPRALMKKRRLVDRGMSEADAERIEDRANRLPNLWLLANTTNQEKGKKLPLEWFATLDDDRAEHLRQMHWLQELVEDPTEFDTFYEARKARLRPLLEAVFARPGAVDATSEALEGLSEASEVSHGASWSEDTLGILEEANHPLAQVLMAAGVPEPADVDREVVRDGLTGSQRSIMNWSVAGANVLLVDHGVSTDGIDASVVVVGEDLDRVTVELRAALGL